MSWTTTRRYVQGRGLMALSLFFLMGCNERTPESVHAAVDNGGVQGKGLAAKYCQSCHLLPDPSLLDKKSWENGVLPQMGPRLGIFEYQYKKYPNNSGDPNIGRGFYPAAPVMSPEEWGAILAYYKAAAPDSLPEQHRGEPIREDRNLFRVAVSNASGVTGPPATCMVKYDAVGKTIYTSDVLRHSLDRWGKDLTRMDGKSIDGAVVDLLREPDGLVSCNIGTLTPNNGTGGHINFPGGVVEGLMRPVNMAAADLNGDGRQDLVVCEFGYLKGELSWMENQGGGHYAKHVLLNVPGAIRVVVQDANHDGLPDIWALFAQGDESIYLFTNKGHGVFEARQVLRFPPSYGSTSFELNDFNGDGQPDILYTCGDNGDYSTILKPYHGVYIYLNDGKGGFNVGYFFPMNGCYRAMAADFDGSGRLSIAAIAYFADYRRQPEEGFVFLQNAGGMRFSALTVPGTQAGRWMTMDVSDVNGDGKKDIILGNCSVGPGFLKSSVDWAKGPAFEVLYHLP